MKAFDGWVEDWNDGMLLDDDDAAKVAYLAARAAWQAAQLQWHPIETAPKSGMMVRVGWWAGGEWYEDLDFFEDEVWHNYTNHYEHFCAAGSVPGMVGPKEEAPYQYWMPLPQPPKS